MDLLLSIPFLPKRRGRIISTALRLSEHHLHRRPRSSESLPKVQQETCVMGVTSSMPLPSLALR